jgi:Na+/phosphate symporter
LVYFPAIVLICKKSFFMSNEFNQPNQPEKKITIAKRYVVAAFLVIILILVVNVALFLTSGFNKNKYEQQQIKRSLDTLKIQLKQEKEERLRLDQKSKNLLEAILSLQNKDRLLTDSIRLYDSRINKIQKKYENLSRFDNYSSDSLRWYFSNEFK